MVLLRKNCDDICICLHFNIINTLGFILLSAFKIPNFTELSHIFILSAEAMEGVFWRLDWLNKKRGSTKLRNWLQLHL